MYPELKTTTSKPIHCVQTAGEIYYIPEGWNHAVTNLEPTLSVAGQLIMGDLIYEQDLLSSAAGRSSGTHGSGVRGR